KRPGTSCSVPIEMDGIQLLCHRGDGTEGHRTAPMNIASPRPLYSGLACLAAIARFHNIDLSEAHLLQIPPPRPDGPVTPSKLAQIARKAGLSAKVVKLNWARLGRLGQALPAIMILRSGDAVILSGFKEVPGATQVVIRDLRAPNQGFQFLERTALE